MTNPRGPQPPKGAPLSTRMTFLWAGHERRNARQARRAALIALVGQKTDGQDETGFEIAHRQRFDQVPSRVRNQPLKSSVQTSLASGRGVLGRWQCGSPPLAARAARHQREPAQPTEPACAPPAGGRADATTASGRVIYATPSGMLPAQLPQGSPPAQGQLPGRTMRPTGNDPANPARPLRRKRANHLYRSSAPHESGDRVE